MTWQIDDRQNGTRVLTVVHDRLEQSPRSSAGVLGAGWMSVPSGVKTLPETGDRLVPER